MYSWPRCTHTRQAIWSPQPSVHASEPHELSRSSTATSRPSTRIVGELTNRSARARSAESTRTLFTSTSTPDARSTSPTTSSADSRLRSAARQRVQLVKSRKRKSIRSVSGACDPPVAAIGLTAIWKSSRCAHSVTHRDGAKAKRTHRGLLPRRPRRTIPEVTGAPPLVGEAGTPSTPTKTDGLGRPTEAPLGRTRCVRCIGTTSARASSIAAGSSTVAVAMRQPRHSRLSVRACRFVAEATVRARRPRLARIGGLVSEPEEGPCPSCCSTVPVDVDRRRRCQASTPVIRRATRGCVIRLIRPRSRRSSPSCEPPATTHTAADCAH